MRVFQCLRWHWICGLRNKALVPAEFRKQRCPWEKHIQYHTLTDATQRRAEETLNSGRQMAPCPEKITQNPQSSAFRTAEPIPGGRIRRKLSRSQHKIKACLLYLHQLQWVLGVQGMQDKALKARLDINKIIWGRTPTEWGVVQHLACLTERWVFRSFLKQGQGVYPNILTGQHERE